MLRLCINAHAWGGTLTNSDHKLVTTDFQLRDLPRRRFKNQATNNAETQLARDQLYYNDAARSDYQQRLAAALHEDSANLLNTPDVQSRWDQILRLAYTSAADPSGTSPPDKLAASLTLS
ncbi:hypothetical protein PR003_g23468 [Phytophthora rubi]|uniref:Uncharacterized protein n=1 Tax=Phytophthora rubi TaxID=129364 RepID=A0A6A3J5E9_9STRA|nr:hypothetical protein PR001_g21993 [Phytophthora rubi]KAE9297560.1 hypothetical protein PR003_g23468 [Phytophthora rubi]